MSTQLRLIGKTESTARTESTGKAERSGKAGTPQRPLRARAVRTRRPSDRRAVHWADQWRLDARTRAAGLAGVASARAALEARRDDTQLQQAS